MEKTAENALKNLIDAYSRYSDKAVSILHPSQDLLRRLSPSEAERLQRLINEFNAERLQELKDNVVIAAKDFVRFFNQYPFFDD